MKKLRRRRMGVVICDSNEEESEEIAEENNSEIDEFDERIRFIIEEFSDLRIPMKNFDVNLPFCFFCSSKEIMKCRKNGEEEEIVFNGLMNLSLQVDPLIISKLILGIKLSHNAIKNENLKDYYVFLFKTGMEREMDVVLRRIADIHSFSECIDLLRIFCEEGYENDTVCSWLGVCEKKVDIKEVTYETFKTSFALALFDQIRSLQDDLLETPSILLKYKDFIAYIMYVLRVFKSDLHYTCHKNFNRYLPLLRNEYESFTSKEFLEKLQSSETEFRKITLRSRNVNGSGQPVEISVNIIPLILRTNFFFRMLRFMGNEYTTMKEEGYINIQLRSDVLSLILGYCFYNKLIFFRKVNREVLKKKEERKRRKAIYSESSRSRKSSKKIRKKNPRVNYYYKRKRKMKKKSIPFNSLSSIPDLGGVFDNDDEREDLFFLLDLEVLIELIIHCDMYNEKELLVIATSKFRREDFTEDSKKRIPQIIERIGSKLYLGDDDNEDEEEERMKGESSMMLVRDIVLKKLMLITQDSERTTKKVIKKLIRSSHEMKMKDERLEEFKSRNSKLEKENEELKKLLMKYEGKLDDGSNESVLGGGMKRKREDKENEDENNSPKRRKR